MLKYCLFGDGDDDDDDDVHVLELDFVSGSNHNHAIGKIGTVQRLDTQLPRGMRTRGRLLYMSSSSN